MKTLQTLILILAICFSTNVNAQLLKKLKQKAAEAAEKTIEKKVEEKTEKETEKAFDSTFNNQGKLFKGNKEAPNDFYQFSYKYVMEIIQKNKPTELIYYLTNQGQYLGSAVEMKENEQMLTVLDLTKKTAYSFMDLGTEKSMMSFPLDFEKVTDHTVENTEMTIELTGNKKEIIGYHCDEYKVQGENFQGTIWVTQEAPIAFADAFSKINTNKIKSAKGVNQSWLSMVEGLTLEMNMTDTSKKKPSNIVMRCTSLDPTDFKIETASYKSMF